MTLYAGPICLDCTRFRRTQPPTTKTMSSEAPPPTSHCAAFPDGIPLTIWLSVVDHREPYEGDHTLQFAPRNQDAAAYAQFVFGREEPPLDVSVTTKSDQIDDWPLPINLDADPQNANWAKRTWDLSDIDSEMELTEFLDSIGMTVEEFKGLPIYRWNKEKPGMAWRYDL